MVSVFDTGFVLGDGVWEGLRVIGGHPPSSTRTSTACTRARRRSRSTSASTARELRRAIYETLDANDMTDGVHVRLMVTRGVKRTPYQDPRVTVGPATIVIIPEYKEPRPADPSTRDPRCSPCTCAAPYPDVLDPKLNSPQQAQRHHRLHPGLHGRRGRGADARPARLRRHLQLDPLLHRAQGRAVDVDRRLLPRRHHPRATCCACAATPASRRYERNFSLTDVYGADEAFVTGTFAGVVPVREVDGRSDRRRAQPAGACDRLQTLYQAAVERDVAERATLRAASEPALT